MDTKDRFEEDDGVWRAMLPRWTAPAAPDRLELALRGEFRRRHRRDTWRLWAGRAAVLALAASAALLVRVGGPARFARDGDPDAEHRDVAVAQLDLSGFEPVAQPRLERALPAATQTSLEGFEPVRKMTMTRRTP